MRARIDGTELWFDVDGAALVPDEEWSRALAATPWPAGKGVRP